MILQDRVKAKGFAFKTKVLNFPEVPKLLYGNDSTNARSLYMKVG